jgi:hypothetical protein
MAPESDRPPSSLVSSTFHPFQFLSLLGLHVDPILGHQDLWIWIMLEGMMDLHINFTKFFYKSM